MGVWDTGQKEPWILVSDLADPARQVIRWYGKRFQIEEMFRDQKSYRFGWGLGQLHIYQADRLECLLLIIAFAQFIALMLGACARHQGLDRQLQSNTRRNRHEQSDFFLGRYYIFRITWRHQQLIQAFYSGTEN